MLQERSYTIKSEGITNVNLNVQAGMYFVSDEDGNVRKLIVE
jgi:hypothetical protein